MDQLIQKDFTSTRNLTYHYHISSPSHTPNKKPTLLFLHGWPDSSALWQSIAPTFLSLGYKVLVPDLLGLGKTSKPTDPSLYGIGHIVKDLAEILDAENIQYIIPIGHDWGSGVAQRMYLFYPERCAGIVLLNVGYTPPMKAGAAGPKTPDELNDMFEKMDRYRRFEYHSFFLQPDAAKIWEENPESAWVAMHRNKGPEGMKEMFCTPGFAREYISAGRTDPLKGYAENPAVRDAWINEVKTNGLRASFNWYHAVWNGHHAEAEKDLPEGSGVVNVPMLYLSCDEDVLCPGKDILQHKQAGVLPDLTTDEIHAGHWVPYEAPDEVTRLIKGWLEAKKL